MRKIILFLTSFTIAQCCFASNFADCILEKMPKASNGASHQAILRICTNDYPFGFYAMTQGTGLGVFNFTNVDACIVKNTKDMAFQPAVTAISSACVCLYRKPEFDGQLCFQKFIPH